MDQLINNIRNHLDAVKAKYEFIPVSQSVDIIIKLAKKYNFDVDQRYLWEGKSLASAIDYLTESDGISSIGKLLNKFEADIFLVVTDDEFFPWPVFKFPQSYLIELLEDNNYFEFFIFDSSMKCVLFDTHDNSLFLFEYDFIAGKV